MEPAWIASLVFTIARETGWPEDFILWRLPFTRALQYNHCALRYNGAWTVPMNAEAAPADLASLEALEKQAASLADLSDLDWL